MRRFKVNALKMDGIHTRKGTQHGRKVFAPGTQQVPVGANPGEWTMGK